MVMPVLITRISRRNQFRPHSFTEMAQDQIEKLVPQPQDATAFGFLI